MCLILRCLSCASRRDHHGRPQARIDDLLAPAAAAQRRLLDGSCVASVAPTAQHLTRRQRERRGQLGLARHLTQIAHAPHIRGRPWLPDGRLPLQPHRRPKRTSRLVEAAARVCCRPAPTPCHPCQWSLSDKLGRPTVREMRHAGAVRGHTPWLCRASLWNCVVSAGRCFGAGRQRSASEVSTNGRSCNSHTALCTLMVCSQRH